MGTKFGAVAWSEGGEDRGVCMCICLELRCWRWDASAFAGTGIFATKDPCVIPSSCMSSAWKSRLKASSGLRSAHFSVVYGQAKWNCLHGQAVRVVFCQIWGSVMLPNAHGHCIIYFSGSPFCLIKRGKKKKNPTLSKTKPTRPLSTYAAFNYD